MKDPRQDARKLHPIAQEALRLRAVRQVIDNDQSPELVAQTFGIHRATMYEWLSVYAKGGYEALKRKPHPGRAPRLDEEQQAWLSATVTLQTPQDFDFPTVLWTRKLLCAVIEREFGIRYTPQGMGRLLRRLQLSPQVPLRRAYEQDPQALAQWQENEYPAIVRQAQEQGAVVMFSDEAGVRSDEQHGRTWAPAGERPVLPTTGRHCRLNLLSAITPEGKLRFMGTDETVNAKLYCSFLGRLLQSSEQPIHLIIDRHPVHTSKTVRQFVAATEGRLTLHFLPAYSPESNPDEWLWSYLKAHTIGKFCIEGQEHLRHLVRGTLRRLQKIPALVRSFFHAPDVIYTLAPLSP